MGDWTGQNWTKRDGRNNQEEEQEKKVMYKTAAELAVKKKNDMVYCGGGAFAAAQIKGKLIEFYDRSWQLQLICIFGGSGR